MSHFTYTVLLAALLAAATALPGRRMAQERACSAVYTFAVCLAAVIGGGWLMYLIHG